MKIAIGQVWQESNTFNPIPTTRSDFEAMGVYRGDILLQRMHGVNEPGGFIDELQRWPERPALQGLARLAAWPGGALDRETFAWVVHNLVAPLETGPRPDAVLLALHGSMSAEGDPDTEGVLLSAVRDRVGPDVPVVATLDLHANVTSAMVEAADALLLYHTVPHIDVYQTGIRAARLLRRILCDGVRPVSGFCKLPMVVPAELADTQSQSGPAAGRAARLESMEAQPSVLAAGVATVQPWLDIPELGSAALVVTDGDPALASEHATQLAGDLWSRRESYLSVLMPYQEAVALVHKSHLQSGLTVLGEGADATTSGAPGDSSWILAELLNYRWQRPAIVAAVAPELVRACHGAGVGASIRAELGGARDTRFGRRFEFQARIDRLFEARFVLSGHLGRNLPIDMGAAVTLRQGQVVVVLTERSGPHFALELFNAAGADPFDAALLVAKSPCGFRAVYGERASRIISVLSPGCAAPNFQELPYENISRPLWPWDRDLAWTNDTGSS